MSEGVAIDFLKLVRLGIGHHAEALSKCVDWNGIEVLAYEQGLLGIVVDGIEKLLEERRPPKELLLQWIGCVMNDESCNVAQRNAAAEMALLFHRNYIRTYVLKGAVIAECYPNPHHRWSVDMDCFLLPQKGHFDAWALGNDLMKSNKFEVSDGFYKNSTFYLPGLMVENHRFMIPFRGNKKLKCLEIILQGMMKDDKGEDIFENTYLYRPPVMVSALFLIEHAYSHFLSEGLTWKHVLDWMMFSKKHKGDIDWYSFDALIDEFGFRKFYESYYRLGKFLVGEIKDSCLTYKDKRMLKDVWSPLDLHETLHGVNAKLSFAFSTIRAAWKYHYFSEISMPHALWIQVKGFLFIKHPTLD